MDPKVFIVVVNWNRAKDTASCVRSLGAMTYPCFEVLVVDNASRDGSMDILRTQFPDLMIIQNPENLGYAEGNNVGIRYALAHGAQYVLLLNNDTMVQEDLLTDLVGVAQRDSTIGLVGPAIYDDAQPTKVWFAGARIDWKSGESPHTGLGEVDQGQFKGIVEVDRLTGCAMLIKREVFEKVGLLDGDYFLYYEDVDLCVRAKKAGYKNVCVQTAKVWHKESSSTKAKEGSALHAYYYTRNKLLFLKKYSQPWDQALRNSRGFCTAYFRHVIRHPFDWKYRQEHSARAWATVWAIRDFYAHRWGINPKYHESCVGMRIAVDATPFLTRRTGVGQYLYYLLREMIALDPANEWILCGAGGWLGKTRLSGLIDSAQYGRRIDRLAVRVPFPLFLLIRWTVGSFVRWGAFLSAWLAAKTSGLDLYWSGNYFGRFGSSYKTAITIHDMAWQYFPQHIYHKTYRDLSKKLLRHAQRADAVLVVSEQTKRDVMQHLGVPKEKIRVIYHGVAEQFCPNADCESLQAVRKKYGLPDRFILFVGMLEPRKNIVGLIRAYKRLAEDPHIEQGLVIAGAKGWQYAEIFKTVRDLGLEKRVVFTGYVADADLPFLYNAADVFVYPSFYEGFGLPVLEAMACGIPTIVSRVSSLPEVAHDACLYINNPADVDEISAAMKRLLSEEALRQSLREKGLERVKEFSWKKSARQVLDVFEEIRGIKSGCPQPLSKARV